MDRVSQASRMPLTIEEEALIGPPPKSHTLLGSESFMVCTFKRLPTNEIRYICTNTKNQKIRFLVLGILDQFIDQLHILCGGRFCNFHFLALFDEVLKVKNDEPRFADPIYDIKTGELFPDAFTKTKLNKHFSDTAKLKEFIIAVKNEIRDFHSFQVFRDVMYNVKVKMQSSRMLIDQAERNHNKMKYLKYALATQGQDCRLELHKINTEYSSICREVANLGLENLIKQRYANAYENSRFEQNKIKCERECREMQTIITKYRHKISLEERVHNEVTNFISINETDIKRDTNEWMDRYHKDMEDTQFKILQITENLENLVKRKDKLKVLFADHKKSIEDWKDYKEKKRIKDEEKERLINAATKIQAWWRGNMYRHKLGPYNPNKKGKRKGTKKNK